MTVRTLRSIRSATTALACLYGLCGSARAAERVTLRDGFEIVCTRHEPAGDRVRLYLAPAAATDSAEANYMEVPTASILRTEAIADPPTAVAAERPQGRLPALTADEMHQMLASAGARHNLDADLLASVIHAESAGKPRAVSRAGAAGLMQLMPATAADFGVTDRFAPEQNIGGGTAYLDRLLTRYHENLALALAAYNAGPAAVDRFHGVPPFAETRAYVARVIGEFNRRKRATASSATLRAAN